MVCGKMELLRSLLVTFIASFSLLMNFLYVIWECELGLGYTVLD